MKKNCICLILSVIGLLSFTFGLCACGKETIKDDDAPYTFTNKERALPQYEKDIFTIDGVIDEDIYGSLRWWSETYSESEFFTDCNVNATCYFGENGVYFTFDVDDDNVNVNPSRASFVNSCVSLYVAEYGTNALYKNVWEIDILPNSTVNAKRYLNNLGFVTVFAEGDENKPYAKAVTKGGELNTKECKGYTIETYFTYDYLFGKNEKPEYLNLNFALIRSFSSADTAGRDLYYNFGEHRISNWSWGNPATWYKFFGYGFDAVKIVANHNDGGKIETDGEYAARYSSPVVEIIPDEGYRIKTVRTDDGKNISEVTEGLYYADGAYRLKLFNVSDDVTVIAEFAAYEEGKSVLAGTVTFNGAPLDKESVKDLFAAYTDGGKEILSDISENGTYSLSVNNGTGKLEIRSERGYSVKTASVTVSGDKTLNVGLTEEDYGKTRNVSLPNSQVMGNGEELYSGGAFYDTVDNTFIYNFTVKYDGKIKDEQGNLLQDPTEGRNENAFTACSVRGMFVDGEGKDVLSQNFLFQLMHWDKNWYLKLYADGVASDCRIDKVINSVGEDGLNVSITLSDGVMCVYYRLNGVAYKAIEIPLSFSADRYLKTLRFYGEENVDNAIWKITEQTIDFGYTDDALGYKVRFIDGMEEHTFDTSEKNVTFEKAYTVKPNSVYIARYKIKSSAVTATGDVTANAQIYFNTWTNEDGGNVWATNYGVMFYLDKSGNSRLYGWSNSNWTNRTAYLGAAALKKAAADGMDLFVTFDGEELAVWIETEEGVLQRVMKANAKGRYFIAHKGDVYANSAPLTVSAEVIGGESGAFGEVFERLYGTEYSIKGGMPYKLSETAETEYKTAGENRDFEATYPVPAPKTGYVAKYTIKSSGLAFADKTSGNVIYINTWTNEDGKKWGTSPCVNYGIMLMFDDRGLKLYAWSNSGWAERNYYLTDVQKKFIAGDGLDIFITHDGAEFAAYTEVSEGVLEKAFSAQAAGKYFVGRKATVYANNPDMTIFAESFGLDGLSVKDGIESIYQGEYAWKA